MERRTLTETDALMRNVPMSSREWRELVDIEDTIFVNDADGALALAFIEGEPRLYWSFPGVDEMRSSFPALFEELRPALEDVDADFISTDLVEFLNRDWILPVLQDADFEFFSEWMELVHPQLDPDTITRVAGVGRDLDLAVEAPGSVDASDGDAAGHARSVLGQSMLSEARTPLRTAATWSSDRMAFAQRPSRPMMRPLSPSAQ